VVGGGFCGDGSIDVGEQCDGSNLNGVPLSCASYSSSFVSGVLGCDGDCLISTGSCVGYDSVFFHHLFYFHLSFHQYSFFRHQALQGVSSQHGQKAFQNQSFL